MTISARPATRRLFHEDAACINFEAVLLEHRVLASGTGGPVGHELLLDQTAFYATSGGQPYDTGRLGGFPVFDVRDEEGLIWHRVAGDVPPTAGTRVEGAIDGPRRTDHMQQHTGQHVLSQAFIETAGAETVSFHLGVDAVTIDLSRSALTPAQLEAAERRANEIVMEDRPIRTHWTTREEIHRFPLRKPPVVEGAIRIVEISDYDWSACGGTHVAATGRIGPIKILGTGIVKQGTRVEFLCGRRALDDYAWKHELIRRTAGRFSTLDRELGVSIQRLEDEHRDARRRLKLFEEEHLDREAASLLTATAADGSGRRLMQLERPEASLEELKGLALRLKAFPGVVVLLAGPSAGGALPLVFARADDRPEDMGQALKAALAAVGGKGGGRPEMAQGQAPDAGQVEAVWTAALGVLDAG